MDILALSEFGSTRLVYLPSIRHRIAELVHISSVICEVTEISKLKKRLRLSDWFFAQHKQIHFITILLNSKVIIKSFVARVLRLPLRCLAVLYVCAFGLTQFEFLEKSKSRTRKWSLTLCLEFYRQIFDEFLQGFNLRFDIFQ